MVQPPIVPRTVVAPGNSKSTVVQTGVPPGVQKAAPDIVFFDAHIVARYLPGATHTGMAQALALAPQVLANHCVSAHCLVSPASGTL